MAYACPIWELAAGTYHIKLQRLQNKVLRTIEHFPRFTSVPALHTTFNFPYVYDYITDLCRQQTEVTQNHENEHAHGRGEGEAKHRKCKKLKVGGGQTYGLSSD
jgi:hypothetical protein